MEKVKKWSINEIIDAVVMETTGKCCDRRGKDLDNKTLIGIIKQTIEQI